MKAREIIPGWPRGRSTERRLSFMRSFMRWPAFMELFKWQVIRDPRFQEDLEGERAEERRKVAMIEAYYEMKRIEARGSLRPQTASERMTFFFPLPMGIAPDTMHYIMEMQKLMEVMCGMEAPKVDG